MKRVMQCLTLVLGMLIVGCTATKINSTQEPLVQPHASWGVVPFVNNTETPLAGDRAKAIVAGLMRTHGVTNLTVYKPAAKKKQAFNVEDESMKMREALRWARQHDIRYVMAGTVNEWRYKVGLDGEPVVGITLKLLDTYTGQVIWTSVGSKSGGSRVALSTIVQQLIDHMLRDLYKGIE